LFAPLSMGPGCLLFEQAETIKTDNKIKPEKYNLMQLQFSS
jgi:hypothetical protein